MRVIEKYPTLTIVASHISDGDFSPRSMGARGERTFNDYVKRVRAGADAIGVRFDELHTVQPVHKDTIIRADARHSELHLDADGLITHAPGIAIAVQGADCPPVVIHDPVSHATAMLHSGRGGTMLNIVDRAVRTLTRTTGAPADRLRAWIGPSICGNCYEVNEATTREFPVKKAIRTLGDKRYGIDLTFAILMQLIQAGVRVLRVEDVCTLEDPHEWHSYRRDSKEHAASKDASKPLVPKTNLYFAVIPAA